MGPPTDPVPSGSTQVSKWSVCPWPIENRGKSSHGDTHNSWGPRAIGDHGAPVCPCPNSKKPMKKVPGTSHGAPY
ncbi:unnamed protein product [Staurois parvus]|uniref:Uncharacterized protein n=1 Tax=Staurois parvus TaxID=386267 RepID=A0ABN9BUK6_9NEOB|nr:unnamed protein product [Staurois parvus]